MLRKIGGRCTDDATYRSNATRHHFGVAKISDPYRQIQAFSNEVYEAFGQSQLHPQLRVGCKKIGQQGNNDLSPQRCGCRQP